MHIFRKEFSTLNTYLTIQKHASHYLCRPYVRRRNVSIAVGVVRKLLNRVTQRKTFHLRHILTGARYLLTKFILQVKIEGQQILYSLRCNVKALLIRQIHLQTTSSMDSAMQDPPKIFLLLLHIAGIRPCNLTANQKLLI